MTPNPPLAYGSGMHIGGLHVLGWPAFTPVLLRTPGSVCAKAIPGNSGAPEMPEAVRTLLFSLLISLAS